MKIFPGENIREKVRVNERENIPRIIPFFGEGGGAEPLLTHVRICLG